MKVIKNRINSVPRPDKNKKPPLSDSKVKKMQNNFSFILNNSFANKTFNTNNYKNQYSKQTSKKTSNTFEFETLNLHERITDKIKSDFYYDTSSNKQNNGHFKYNTGDFSNRSSKKILISDKDNNNFQKLKENSSNLKLILTDMKKIMQPITINKREYVTQNYFNNLILNNNDSNNSHKNSYKEFKSDKITTKIKFDKNIIQDKKLAIKKLNVNEIITKKEEDTEDDITEEINIIKTNNENNSVKNIINNINYVDLGTKVNDINESIKISQTMKVKKIIIGDRSNMVINSNGKYNFNSNNIKENNIINLNDESNIKINNNKNNNINQGNKEIGKISFDNNKEILIDNFKNNKFNDNLKIDVNEIQICVLGAKINNTNIFTIDKNKNEICYNGLIKTTENIKLKDIKNENIDKIKMIYNDCNKNINDEININDLLNVLFEYKEQFENDIILKKENEKKEIIKKYEEKIIDLNKENKILENKNDYLVNELVNSIYSNRLLVDDYKKELDKMYSQINKSEFDIKQRNLNNK